MHTLHNQEQKGKATTSYFRELGGKTSVFGFSICGPIRFICEGDRCTVIGHRHCGAFLCDQAAKFA